MAEARPLRAHGSQQTGPTGATGVVVFADGRTIWGQGFGAEGEAVGELCFNTAMTGYQEVMTDPSYARQVIAFTFPHIGNVGANDEDVEAGEAHALGCFVREAVTGPSNFRATQDFPSWMAATTVKASTAWRCSLWTPMAAAWTAPAARDAAPPTPSQPRLPRAATAWEA